MFGEVNRDVLRIGVIAFKGRGLSGKPNAGGEIGLFSSPLPCRIVTVSPISSLLDSAIIDLSKLSQLYQVVRYVLAKRCF